MTDLAEPLNQALFGFTRVISVEVFCDESSCNDYPTYHFRATLENDKRQRIELLSNEITELKLNCFHQFPYLRASDVRAQQLDHVTLKFTEEGFDGIAFSCRKAEVRRLN